MLKVRVGNADFIVGTTSKLHSEVQFFITKVVDIPSWQLFIFREKQSEDPTFNGMLRNTLLKTLSQPFSLGPVNTTLRTRGCKSCGKFTLHYYSQHFPTKDKFEALQREANKVLATLRELAQ